jgi:hypothetical protein
MLSIRACPVKFFVEKERSGFNRGNLRNLPARASQWQAGLRIKILASVFLSFSWHVLFL